MKLRRRRRVKAFPQKRSQRGGVGAMPRPVHLAGQWLRRRPDKCDAGCRRHKLHITRFRRCRRRKLAHSAAPPSSHRNRFAGFRREPCWEVIKTPALHFFGVSAWGWYHYHPAAVKVSEQPRAGLFQQKKRLSQSGCSAPTDALFPPAHSAFSAFLYGGDITTLGVRFMPLKRWTRRSYGGVFAVFMPSRCSPCAG